MAAPTQAAMLEEQDKLIVALTAQLKACSAAIAHLGEDLGKPAQIAHQALQARGRAAAAPEGLTEIDLLPHPEHHTVWTSLEKAAILDWVNALLRPAAPDAKVAPEGLTPSDEH